MVKLLDAGVATSAIFCNIASNHDTMRAYLTEGVGLDVRDFKGDFIEVAKLLAAWEDAKRATT